MFLFSLTEAPAYDDFGITQLSVGLVALCVIRLWDSCYFAVAKPTRVQHGGGLNARLI